jgi:hypothetical protein
MAVAAAVGVLVLVNKHARQPAWAKLGDKSPTDRQQSSYHYVTGAMTSSRLASPRLSPRLTPGYRYRCQRCRLRRRRLLSWPDLAWPDPLSRPFLCCYPPVAPLRHCPLVHSHPPPSPCFLAVMLLGPPSLPITCTPHPTHSSPSTITRTVRPTAHPCPHRYAGHCWPLLVHVSIAGAHCYPAALLPCSPAPLLPNPSST